jgi:hypothetical protein
MDPWMVQPLIVFKFDVFSGFLKKDPKWIQSVEGCGAAIQVMSRLSVVRPGPYFVFDRDVHKVVATIDTSPKLKRRPTERRSPNAGAI